MSAPRQQRLFTTDDLVPQNDFDQIADCPSFRHCITEGIPIPPGLDTGPFATPIPIKFSLPRFIPMVNPLDRRTFAHQYMPGVFPAIVVQSWPLFQNRAGLERVLSRGLPDALGYDGETILTSVMPDKYILQNDVDWFIDIVKRLGPSAAITWDVPTYINHPRKSSLGWVLEGADAARKMSAALDIPLIGLVSGADLEQVKLSSALLRELGFNNQAIACREYVKAWQMSFLGACVQTVKQGGTSAMMLSCSSPKLFTQFSAADYLVGMGWFNQAYRGKHVLESKPRFKHASDSEVRQLVNQNLLATLDASRVTPESTLQEVFWNG